MRFWAIFFKIILSSNEVGSLQCYYDASSNWVGGVVGAMSVDGFSDFRFCVGGWGWKVEGRRR